MCLRKKRIYCNQEDQNRFRGVEHVVPKSFGTFGSETPTLDCVCDDCNGFFGRGIDQNLARETLEGVTRYARGQYSSEARPQQKLNITLDEGSENGDFAGFKVAVDGTTGKLNMLPQFQIVNLRTGEGEVYLMHQIAGLKLPEESYGKPGINGETGTWKCKIMAPTKQQHDALVEALQSNGIDFKPGKPLTPPAAIDADPTDEITVPVIIEAEVDTLHKRAIAKILMNFVARYLGCDEALKPRWDFLRSYVRYGQGLIKARMTDRPFWTGQESDTLRFTDDSFNVRVENINGHIIGVMQFYGHKSFEMILVENDSLPPESEIAYRFTPGSKPLRGEKRKVDPA
jgi:hypothetical protein